MRAARGAAGKEWGFSEPGGGGKGGKLRSAARARRAEGSRRVPSPEPLGSASPPLPRPRVSPEGTPDPGPRPHPERPGDPGSPAPRPGSSGRSPAPRPLARPPRLPPSGAGAGPPRLLSSGAPGIKATADTGLRVWGRQRRAEASGRSGQVWPEAGRPRRRAGGTGSPYSAPRRIRPARLRAGQILGGPRRRWYQRGRCHPPRSVASGEVLGLPVRPGCALRARTHRPPAAPAPGWGRGSRSCGLGLSPGTSADRGACPPPHLAGAPHVAHGRLRVRTDVREGRCWPRRSCPWWVGRREKGRHSLILRSHGAPTTSAGARGMSLDPLRAGGRALAGLAQ